MTHFDVFNGDADGLASFVQLRLAHRQPSVLVTGTKRDVHLLDRVPARLGDSVTVLDVSLAANRDALDRLLASGVAVEYFDHHYAGDQPLPPSLVPHLDPSPHVCTGILVDRHLHGRHRIWAVVAAFGDNLAEQACELASSLSLRSGGLDALSALAECLTYNTYGDRLDDAVVRPDELARVLLRHVDPLRFVATDPLFAAIDEARQRDLACAARVRPTRQLQGAWVYLLPDAAWARRLRGLLGNQLANAQPLLAHAILTRNVDGGFAVSVRAPRADPRGADALCRQFATGGGREAAAGITHLPCERFDDFVGRLARAYPHATPR